MKRKPQEVLCFLRFFVGVILFPILVIHQEQIHKMESITLKIENIVDIDALSREYDMAKEDLISFHNQHCALHEILPEALPKYIQYLYLPADKYRNWEKKQVQISRIDMPATLDILTYGVLIRQYPSDVQINYLVDIQKKEENEVSVKRHKLYVDEIEVELMVEKMMETAGEALYPLKLSLGNEGKIENILNVKEIISRWNKKYLPALQAYYKGKTAEDIMEKQDRFYKNMGNGPEVLDHNIFYSIFFLPLYGSYPDYQKKEELSFYFSPIDEMVSFDASFSLQKTYTEQGKIVIQIRGEQNNAEVGLEKGCLDLIYKLDKETNSIFSVEGNLSTFYNKEEFKVYIEIYHQKSYI